MKYVPFLFLLIFVSCNNKTTEQSTSLKFNFNNLHKIHQILGEPLPGEWREAHPEISQPVDSFVQKFTRIDNRGEKIIYILPIGEMNETQQAALNVCHEFIQVFFGVKVELLEAVGDQIIPDSARRVHLGTEQLLSKFILYRILKPKIPDDGLAMFAITENDLYPREGWNFVFGQASLRDKVGVASMYRLNAGRNEVLFRKRLMRTVAHELCHILQIKHCQKYACLMNGSNSLEEADKRPLWLCPGCLRKLTWHLGYDADESFQSLQKFYDETGFRTEFEFISKSAVHLRQN
jgi:archaemetzincin